MPVEFLKPAHAMLDRPWVKRLGRFGRAVEALDAKRPFRSGAIRTLILYHPNTISISQLHPFIYWQEIAGAEALNLDVRAMPCPDVQARGLATLPDADVVLFQPSFFATSDEVREFASRLRERFPRARLGLVDSNGHAALLWADAAVDIVDVYLRKSVLKDRSFYQRRTIGDTNLTDYYARRCNIEIDEFDIPVPERFFDKLLIGPSFLTGVSFMRGFSRPFAEAVHWGDRAIDLHARIAVKGVHWYAAMRGEAEAAAKALQGFNVVMGRGVSLAEFMRELHDSKATFSPFGYGEPCWRDFEAFLTGSVLIKPDMDHLEMTPNLFIDGEDYVALRWDVTDLEEKLTALVQDEARRFQLASTAYGRVHDYITGGGLGQHVRDVILGPAGAVVTPERATATA